MPRLMVIKAASALGVPKQAPLSEELDIEDLPLLSPNGAPIVAVEDELPENGIVYKVVFSQSPKHFAGLAAVVGLFRVSGLVKTFFGV